MFVMKIESFYAKDKVFYAHRQNDNGKRETLKEHTELCCDYFRKIFPAEKYGAFWKNFKRMCKIEKISTDAEVIIKDMWYGVPLFHDMGKINPIFQNKNMDNLIMDSDGMKRFSPLSSKHSLFSAVLYINTFTEKIKEQIGDKEERRYCIFLMFCNAYVISRHHSDMSCFDNFLDSFYEGNEAYEIVRILNEACGKEIYAQEIFLKTDEDRVTSEKLKIFKILKNFREKYIIEQTAPVFYTYIRLLYSVLIAADYYSTTEFCNDMKIEILSCETEINRMRNIFENSELLQKIRNYQQRSYGKISDLKKVHDINIMRNELFLDAENNLLEEPQKNIYYLEAPTGSGKSNTAFQLSFLLQKINRMEKIFYVYPFNTLVEQNYDTLSNIFENAEAVMDNIAVINSITPIFVKNTGKENDNNQKMETKEKIREKTTDTEDNSKLYTEALLNRQFLNYPLVLTTSVSLFQYLFSEKQESLMGFHKFQNSVIILDEIQNYKNDIWTEIITFLDTFSELLNMKVIIMSATLPDLNYLIQGEHRATRLIKNREKYYQNPVFANRVLLHYDLMKKKMTAEALYSHLERYRGSKKKILVEFINRKSAVEFYAMLKEKEEQGEFFQAEIVLMTGEDNQAERKRLIALAKEERKEKAFILIATQVVEAGVDIDMDIGYKDCSLLDAEEQFLGRINRSCRRSGEVWFFDMDDEKIIYRNDLRVPSEFTIRREKMREILSSKDFSEYYLPLLNDLKSKNREINENNVEIFFESIVGRLNFKETAEKMKLLDEKEWCISVYLCREIGLENGTILHGKGIWDEYKKLLKDDSIDYAKKRILLSRVRRKMNYFIYDVKKCDFVWNDQIGELYCIEKAEQYFIDGKFNAAVFEKWEGTII